MALGPGWAVMDGAPCPAGSGACSCPRPSARPAFPSEAKTFDPRPLRASLRPSLCPRLHRLWLRDGGPGRPEPLGWAEAEAGARGLLWRPPRRGRSPPWGRPSEEGAEAAVWWVWALGTLRKSSCPCRLEPADRPAPAPRAKPSMIDYGGRSHQAEWARISQAAAWRGRGGPRMPPPPRPAPPTLACPAPLSSAFQPQPPSPPSLWGLRASPREAPLPQGDQVGGFGDPR